MHAVQYYVIHQQSHRRLSIILKDQPAGID